jgi:hypothetical protein
VKQSCIVNAPTMKLRAASVLVLLGLSASLLACKDEDPCDPGQESIGTGCYPIATGGSAGSTSTPLAGAPSDGGAAGQPAAGNPDATFGTPCESDAECGGDAPVCATDPLFYCTQLDCNEGEENAGVCPEDWSCVHLPPQPSACVNLNAL